MSTRQQSVRIGNAQAFWGDRTAAAAEMLAREPELDFLTLDYLAEVSMSILAVQRERDRSAGYAREFVDVVRSLAPYWSAGGRCRLITNAGGLNPRGCADACAAALAAAGCRSLKIGVVSGDDVLQLLRDSAARAASHEFQNLDSGETIDSVRDRLVTANAYLGAAPIVEALANGADIVVTGRVADPSLTLAAAIYHFGWNGNDLDRLAGATVAGHLIECGTQVTGGISTDWLDVNDPAHIGFPIVEVTQDGSCIVTKPQGTGGCANSMTVREQLVYEIGDPENYLSPDVAVSFLSLDVEDFGNDRVRVSGATGKPMPPKLKVSATFRDGFRAAGMLTIIGRNAEAKARRVGELVLQRVREAGFDLRDSIIECLGDGGATNGIVRKPHNDRDTSCETVLRVAVESESREAVECFSRELMPFITAGPQGTTGYAEGRPKVHPVFRYWPCLIDRKVVAPNVEIISSFATSHSKPPKVSIARAGLGSNDIETNFKTVSEKGTVPFCSGGLRKIGTVPNGFETGSKRSSQPAELSDRPSVHLYDIATARSGDKGSSANIGVIARSSNDWPLLQKWLTAERVAEYLAPLSIDSVDRYELPNLHALNFVVHGVLRSKLRTDAQGKALGQILLEMKLPES